MVTNRQVRKLWALLENGKPLSKAADQTDMDIKTARKYSKLKKLPSRVAAEHTWRTREDPFADIWDDIKSKLTINEGLEAKYLFEYYQRTYPGRFSDGQLRTFQRRMKHWRATEGPAKEIYFEQIHEPGARSQSDFTYMNDLDVTIDAVPLRHLIYHFVLPYSNYETGTLCFSECFEALSEGLQNALFEIGGVPLAHQTDRLTTAVNKDTNPDVFTRRYAGLLAHYGMEGLRTQVASPNENGDVEQSHHRFKKAVKQALMLRGSCDFESTDAYRVFLQKLFDQLNAGRRERFEQERATMMPLPARRLESCRAPIKVRVSKFSTIRVLGNIYSVHSRLRGEQVVAKVFLDHIDIVYGQRVVKTLPRLYGKQKHRIDYRDVIDVLVRKPGAFERYRYRADPFPTHRFRVAYDHLHTKWPQTASKRYLKILHLAARENELAVDEALRSLIESERAITPESVDMLVATMTEIQPPKTVRIAPVDLAAYDDLLCRETLDPSTSGDGAVILPAPPFTPQST